MVYILVNEKPYYTNGSKVFPCSLSAEVTTVDFKNPARLDKDATFNCIYTEDEIKQRLGIAYVDTWDEENQKIVKKTNKTISTIPNRTKKE